MKKFIFLFILLFVFTTNTLALSKFYLGEKVPNMYIEEYDDYNLHNGAPFILTRDDGSIVYCINPFYMMNTTDYYNEYSTNNSIFNLTDEQINKINLISYLGYNYYGHTDIKWYGITQFLIWKTIGFNDIYFTDSHYGNRITAYVDEVSVLESMVNNYFKLPSFANNIYEYSSNREYKIIDENEVLYGYEILETNIDAKIINNELYINTKEDGLYEIKFIKKSPVNHDYKLYALEGYQPLIYPGKINDIEFRITIEVNSGDITINKFDSENKNRVEATLEGAVYGIYNKDELINTVETNEEGIAYVDDLPVGEYYVKEIKASSGYQLDTNIYLAKITKENKNIIINSYENIIKGNLVINKYYGEDDNYNLEDKAKFEIYDSNNNLIDSLETNNGSVNTELAYGDYYIVQIEGINGYNFIDKFKISIREEKDYIFDLYNEKEILVVEVPNTYKKSYNKLISLLLIFIGSILIFISKIKTTIH